MTEPTFPYIELHTFYDDQENVVEVDGYIHEDESQKFDNFTQSFSSLENARKWASEQKIPVKMNEETMDEIDLQNYERVEAIQGTETTITYKKN